MKRLEQDAAMKQAEIAAEQQQQQFDNMLAQQQQGLDARFAEMGNVIKMQIVEIQEQGRREAEQLRQQVEIMKNDADNEQHQMTELLKNYQDNLTQMQIAMQKMRDDFSSGADLTPQVEQLNGMLMKVEQQRGQDALAAAIEGLRAVIETMNRPKTLIEDEQGRPVGTR